MTKFSTLLRDHVAPMLRRPKAVQVAALCYRGAGPDKQVLLVTSRGTGRWIIPKGWPIRGLASSEAALQEAWEEAGVEDATAEPASIGTYDYDKILDSGVALPVETEVFKVSVGGLAEEFPEVGQRKRRWVSPKQAAKMVDEPELKSILRVL